MLLSFVIVLKIKLFGSLEVKTVFILEYSTPLFVKMLCSKFNRFCCRAVVVVPSMRISRNILGVSAVFAAKACTQRKVCPDISARFG